MTPIQIGILVATIMTCAAMTAVGIWHATRIPWPSGPRASRMSALGCEVTVIDAPGTEAEQLSLLNACTAATVAVFTAWHVWRPNDVGGAQVFPKIGAHFIDDASMNDIQAAIFNGDKVAAYLSDASSRSKRIPLAVIRKSLAGEMIATGQPLMHEMIHALLNHFVPDDVSASEHAHAAWDLVQGAAVRTFKGLYAPRER